MTNDTTPAHAMDDADATPLDIALARLAASRARLRAELTPPVEPGTGRLDEHGQPQASHWPQSLGALWRRGRKALQAWPMADLAAGLLQDWWQRHPWRQTGETLADAARHAVPPLVRRHPLSALLGAAAIGALLVTTRAWRWPALRSARPPSAQRAGRWLAAQLANPAVQTALLSALMLLVKQWTAQGMAPQPEPPPPPPPG